ncbi:MAG: nitrate/nitrite transport system permease protein [Cycloclasticus sp.]|jgi:nitrate/nitrite transport system permease protein
MSNNAILKEQETMSQQVLAQNKQAKTSQPQTNPSSKEGVNVSLKIISFLNLIGFTWFIPFVKLLSGEDPIQQLKDILKVIGVPVLAMLLFLVFWSWGASKVHTSLGAIPGPAAVWQETKSLAADHYKEKEKEIAFYQRQDVRNVKKLERNPDADVKIRQYTGKATYPQQIMTSLWTVFAGFILASIIAIPLGVICGLSPAFNAAINPIIQIFKPVSPLAWLPIVTLIVSAVYVVDGEPMFSKSFLVSAITVTLCSLWPTLINTAVGVSTIDNDLMNVSKVLQLGWWKTVTKIVLPSSLPMIFTGLRLSLGVGWMVLIAAEMLAQNPGLGKFVWDEFQNGSQHSLGKIMVAVFTIGIIGFMLDRIMLTLQKYFSYGDAM